MDSLKKNVRDNSLKILMQFFNSTAQNSKIESLNSIVENNSRNILLLLSDTTSQNSRIEGLSVNMTNQQTEIDRLGRSVASLRDMIDTEYSEVRF